MNGPYVFLGLKYLRQAAVTLTDAQIKTLHTKPVTIAEAPGPDRMIELFLVNLLAHFVLPYNAYTPNWQALTVEGSGGTEVAQLFNTDPASGNVTKLNGWLTNSDAGQPDHLTRLPAPTFDYSSDVGGLMPSTVATRLAANLNKALVVKITSPTAVSGGGPSNTLTVAVLYSVFDVSTKQFV